MDSKKVVMLGSSLCDILAFVKLEIFKIGKAVYVGILFPGHV